MGGSKMVKEKSKKLFIFLLFFLQICFVVGLVANYNGNQANIFFIKADNYLADYINVAKYSSERNPYFNDINGNGEHAYLPLSYTIFNFLSKLSNYTETDEWSAGYSKLSLAEINMIIILLTLVFFIVLRKMMAGSNVINDILILSLFGSGIYLFTYERGNIIILAAVLAAIYLCGYESENKIYKHLAFACLALSAGLKGFPAIFGILLIYKRKWKDAACLMLYGLIAAFVPFIFLENGFGNIPQWLVNLKTCNEIYKYRYFPRFGYLAFLSAIIALPERYLVYRDTLNSILSAVTTVSCIILVVTNCLQKIKWKKYLALTLVLLMFPTNSALYCGIYMFPIIVLFFSEEHCKFDTIYLILFIIFLNPFQICIWGYSITWHMANFAAMIMFGLMLLENIKLFKEHLKKDNMAIQ